MCTGCPPEGTRSSASCTPGFETDLVNAGVPIGDFAADPLWYMDGRRLPPVRSGLVGLAHTTRNHRLRSARTTLTGMLGDHPPTDPEGFLAFVRSLPVPGIYKALLDAEPLDDPVTFRFSGVFSGVEGPRTLGIRLGNAYMKRLREAALGDAVITKALFRVIGLVDPPQAIMRPAIAPRVARALVRGRPAVPAAPADRL